MKKVFVFLLALALLSMIFVGCKDASPTEELTAPTEDMMNPTDILTPKKVVMLTYGNLGDKGFNDSCAEGMERLKNEYGCEIKVLEMGRDETAYETYLRDVSEGDWDLIIASTWSVLETFQRVAKDYPDKNYLFLDGSTDCDNMIGISYKSNETGFMAGALAALQLNAGGEKIDPDKRIVGCVASMDSANLNDFVVGYIDGVLYVDNTIKIITAYVGSFEDVATCMEMTTQLYNQGAQIVYAPTSQSMLGAITASSNSDKYIIACDTDVYAGLVDADANIVRNILSSSLKRVGDSIVLAATSLWDGSMKLGENYTLGLAENTVGLADNTNYRSMVREEDRKELDAIAAKVASGEIVVRSALAMETSEIEALRNSVKP